MTGALAHLENEARDVAGAGGAFDGTWVDGTGDGNGGTRDWGSNVTGVAGEIGGVR